MALNRAREGGAVTAKEIASSLNAMKFPTARGGEWTPENVYRQLNKQKMKNEAPVAPECSLPSPAPAFANPDGVLTPEGVKRVRAAMAANKLKWEISGKPMSATGRNRLDASIIPGLRGEAPLDGEFLVSLEKWVVAKEDEAAASKER
jgi:hypothetical protein